MVMNLVVNAAHAMGDERGRITIRTGVEGEQVWLEVTSTSPVAWRHVHLNGRYAFREGGPAIDLDAILRRINLD
jgi:signal transduction histidine kinase